jgi:two-component system, OmpR family, response regulator AdeR
MSKNKYKLLLVEDSDDDAVLFDLTLRRTGLHLFFEIVQRFATAEAAIDYFSQPASIVEGLPSPDIVILDLKLPGRSGFDVLESMRNKGPKPLVTVFTASTLPEDRQKAATLGAVLFQPKTFEPAEFSRFLHFIARLADQHH